MCNKSVAVLLLALGAAACADLEGNGPEGPEVCPVELSEVYNNRTRVSVRIDSAVPGEYYSVYFADPYDGDALVRQPALTGFTPVATMLDVPKDVDKLYVVAQGGMKTYDVKDLTITADSYDAAVASTRASDVFKVPAEVMTAVNSVYFPEKTNNVRGENLFKCTDLVISQTPSTGDFDEAEVWLTLLGDGGSRQGQLYGKLWFYTYPSEKRDALTLGDCTFYGVVGGEVVPITYADVRNYAKWVFFTREEFKNNVASYKRFKLGTFSKGVNIGFAYYGNSPVGDGGIRFTTPNLNPLVTDYTLNYLDKSGSYRIENRHLANGFICHVTIGDFQGNILGMENRHVTENGKYDGDYNDIICLLQSNPKAIEPNDSVDIGNSGSEDPEKLECKTTAGIYLFEDNYPWKGDFDFNDAIIQYEIKDYYKSKNQAKQVSVRALATGSSMTNQFGFRSEKNGFSCLMPELQGFHNVYAGWTWEELAQTEVQTFYGAIQPCMLNGRGVEIYLNTFAETTYPCVLDIPLSDPDDASWKFLWPVEGKSIDDCYYFLKSASGGDRAGDWYRTVKNADLLYQR